MNGTRADTEGVEGAEAAETRDHDASNASSSNNSSDSSETDKPSDKTSDSEEDSDDEMPLPLFLLERHDESEMLGNSINYLDISPKSERKLEHKSKKSKIK